MAISTMEPGWAAGENAGGCAFSAAAMASTSLTLALSPKARLGWLTVPPLV
jgi:hypothetical protein